MKFLTLFMAVPSGAILAALILRACGVRDGEDRMGDLLKFLAEAIVIFWVAMAANFVLAIQWLARRPGIRHLRYRAAKKELDRSIKICTDVGIRPIVMGREFRRLQEIREGKA